MKHDSRFPNLYILDHPLIQHKLSHMRDRDTSTRTFRELLREITLLMGYEITRNLPLTTKSIETPLQRIDAPVIAGKKLVVVPVLRAGIGMSDGLLELVPSARVGHIGVYRDPATHRPVEYLVRLPDLAERFFILCDPMLATGN
ncbi:MAG: uracil phosphoribosyltransferase, partial [Herminiimonas sp.]|nr:uracil phosphoribosyltransferase [Herminiimonas sp.]